ncbi:hypothetical protein BIU98_02565 [Curtobacterium sp. MMLR14_010]|uniref:hypothetical protein n=1 Tax=Curtobacterium sp. MMLR14_010 TaxID=1898743 RepID=UPI0008DE5CA8|nr:hypothetical protein [Curtobacterium sp. MMLR14_010]OII34860.1 hypothetical protein BIU98_02565 [Curtobacterium sp. MMLR14_010]
MELVASAQTADAAIHDAEAVIVDTLFADLVRGLMASSTTTAVLPGRSRPVDGRPRPLVRSARRAWRDVRSWVGRWARSPPAHTA